MIYVKTVGAVVVLGLVLLLTLFLTDPHSSPFSEHTEGSMVRHGLDKSFLRDRPIPYDDRTVGVYDGETDGRCVRSYAIDDQTNDVFYVQANGFNDYKERQGRTNYDVHYAIEVNCKTGVAVSNAGTKSGHR